MAKDQLGLSSLEERGEEKKPSASEKPKKGQSSKNSDISLLKLFKYADSTDLWLMILGTLGTIADGAATPGTMLIMSSLVNTIGVGVSENFIDTVNKYTLRLVYLSIVVMVAAFLGGYN